MVHSIGPDPSEKGGSKAKATAAAKAASEKLLPEPPPVVAAGNPALVMTNVAGPSVAIKHEPRTPTGMLVPPSRTSSTSSAGTGSNPNAIPYDPYGAGMHYNNVIGQGQPQPSHFAVQNPNSALHYGPAGRAANEQTMTYRIDPAAAANAGQYGHAAAAYGQINSSFEWRNMELQNSIDPGMGTSGTAGPTVQSVAATMKANKYYPVMDASGAAGGGFIQSQQSPHHHPQQQQQQQLHPQQHPHHQQTQQQQHQAIAGASIQVKNPQESQQHHQQQQQQQQQMLHMNNQEFMGYQVGFCCFYEGPNEDSLNLLHDKHQITTRTESFT